MFHSICTFLYSTWTSLILHPHELSPMICMISIKIFRDLLHLAYCIAAEVYQGFVAVVATLFPCIVYQLKFETDCIAAAFVCQGTTTWNCSWDGPCLLVPTGQNMLILLSWLLEKILEPKMVPKNSRTCYSFFILIGGQDFWTQNAIKEGEGKLEIWMQNRHTRATNATTQDSRFWYRGKGSSQGSSKTQSL